MSANPTYTPSRPIKAPRPEEVRIFTESYLGVQNGAEVGGLVKRDLEDRYNRATIHRLRLAGPNGEHASVFLSLLWTGAGWRAEVAHDATDYNTDIISHRSASVALRFFEDKD